MRMFAVCVVAIATIACSKSKPATTTPPPDPGPAVTDPTTDPAAPPASTPSDAELEAIFAESVTFLEDLATAVDSNQASCPAMAQAITAVIDQHEPLLKRAKSFEGNQEVDAKADAYMDAHKDRVAAAAGKVGPGMQACAGDAEVQAAMARFDNM
ncbi:MAG: hypothetical protein IPL61_36965 [Myxococcales bacterium]|nr:hypothetical protein [Myxococcales bacterium]